MSAVTVVITGKFLQLIQEILVIVAGLAVVVGIGVLVNYGFHMLRRYGSDTGGGGSYGSGGEYEDSGWEDYVSDEELASMQGDPGPSDGGSP
jgi:hypothetical protein